LVLKTKEKKKLSKLVRMEMNNNIQLEINMKRKSTAILATPNNKMCHEIIRTKRLMPKKIKFKNNKRFVSCILDEILLA
jgi:hypothetical protein